MMGDGIRSQVTKRNEWERGEPGVMGDLFLRNKRRNNSGKQGKDGYDVIR
jgi:hypothetical protein